MVSLGFAILSGVGIGSCVASRPVHYYTLQPATPSASQARPDGLVIVVGSFLTPESLQDGRIRYRRGANEAGSYEYHRWTERPGDIVRNTLVRVLRSSGKYQRVTESSSAAVGDYLLRGKLYEFDELDNASIQTRISLQVELVDRRSNHNVWDRFVEREEPVQSKTVAAVVQSLERNLQSVLVEVTMELDRFLETRRRGSGADQRQ
jgi:cholesterol transport system auxiliary component